MFFQGEAAKCRQRENSTQLTSKRNAILAAQNIGNCAAERQFSMAEGSIRGWQQQKEALSIQWHAKKLSGRERKRGGVRYSWKLDCSD